MALGEQYIESELGELDERQAAAARREMESEIQRLQREAARRLTPAERRITPTRETAPILAAGETARHNAAQTALKWGVTAAALGMVAYAATQ